MNIQLSAYRTLHARFFQGLNSLSDEYKVMLLNEHAAFDTNDTTLQEVAGSLLSGPGSAREYEVSGFGWPIGGKLVEDMEITVLYDHSTKLSASSISATITGGDLDPVYSFVMYNNTSVDKVPMLYGVCSPAVLAVDGVTFEIYWATEGLITWVVTSE